MTNLLPVISYHVDGVILNYLLKNIQSGERVSIATNESLNLNQNNDVDVNNNNKTYDAYDDIDDFVENSADEPWYDCVDTNVPEWAKIKGSVFNDFEKYEADLVWAEDPWVQTPLVDIPSWMMLPGIDFDFDLNPWTNTVDKNEKSTEDLTCPTTIINWADELYAQEPLDVPRWALLPGIDFPSQRRNSPYWQYKLRDYLSLKEYFGQKMFRGKLSCITEE